MTEEEIGKQAQDLPLDGGSLTFRGLVVLRDWEAVQAMASSQRDSFHGVPTLTPNDWTFLRSAAAKDGYTL
jgi:hypothetical protein